MNLNKGSQYIYTFDDFKTMIIQHRAPSSLDLRRINIFFENEFLDMTFYRKGFLHRTYTSVIKACSSLKSFSASSGVNRGRLRGSGPDIFFLQMSEAKIPQFSATPEMMFTLFGKFKELWERHGSASKGLKKALRFVHRMLNL